MDFTAIDFETANHSAASACAVGLVKVRDGKIVDRVGWLIRPIAGHDEFSAWNIRIHGIRPEDVAGEPGWVDRLADLIDFVDGDALAAHNAGFDMGVLAASCIAVGARVPAFEYACSLRIARRTYHLDSYRLPVVAMAAGFEDFTHHEAAGDAEACAAILIHAAGRHGAADLAALAAATGVTLGRIPRNDD